MPELTCGDKHGAKWRSEYLVFVHTWIYYELTPSKSLASCTITAYSKSGSLAASR